MTSKNKIKIMMVAAEASSALYAQRLLEYWQKNDIPVEAFGVGNVDMEELGFEIIGRSEELAVVGVQEVISHWGKIKATFYGLLDECKKRQPHLVLLLDYPDFNLRLAKKVKDLKIPVVYYISPQIWAWRKSRIKIVQKYIDRMLVLFPFEKDFYQKNNVQVDFVGHPLLDELDSKYFDSIQKERSRQKYGVQKNEVLVGLMPGSRKSEIKHHLETQIQVAEKLYSQHPHLKFALLVAPTLSTDFIKQQIQDLKIPLMIIKDQPLDMIQLADVILCASGTATLLVGLLEKPMVIMYKMNFMSAFLAKLFVKSTPFFGMINLILGRRVVPELFQEEASVERLASEIQKYALNAELRHNTAEELKVAKTLLGNKGATVRVAEVINQYV